MDLRKNTIVKGVVKDINDDGQGVIDAGDGVIVFAPFTLPEEQIEGIIINTKSKFGILKATKINSLSKDRTTPPCPYFSKCGGCDIQHIKQDAQLNYKTKKVKNALKRIAHIDQEVLPCISNNEYRYRNKIALPISENGEIGLFRKNTHTVLPITDCLITEEWNKLLIEAITQYINESKISIYSSKAESGLLKFVVARQIEGSILISLVINGTNIPKQDILIKLLDNIFPSFGLNLNINTLNNNVILSNSWKHIYGLKELIASENGITYPVSNASFYQVNNQIKSSIYSRVLSLIDENSTVIDAYSGAGLLSAIISKKAKKCFGVEIVKEATINANQLKNQNKLTNLENINGDCTVEIPKLISKIKSDNIIITLDPPRKGCDKKVLETIKQANPEKIIYISCNPQTLARDLEILLKNNNYKITFVQPYDMFPQTSHVETLVCVEKIASN